MCPQNVENKALSEGHKKPKGRRRGNRYKKLEKGQRGCGKNDEKHSLISKIVPANDIVSFKSNEQTTYALLLQLF